MTNAQWAILRSAFFGFALCGLGVMAKGFHDMVAGWMPELTTFAMLLPIMAIAHEWRERG